MEPISTPALSAWILVHVGALTIAWGTRLATGSRFELLSQLGFFLAMACVGGVACCFSQLELGLSVPSGVTLVGMVLMAVVDLRPTHEPASRLQH
jgi:hypothetical protein